MEPQFVIRRSLAGHLSFAIECTEVRVTKNDKPLERYTLTPEQAMLPIEMLIDMAANNTLTKWQTPTPRAKTLAALNSDLAETVKLNG